MDNVAANLNPAQAEAVESTEGPLLILAGAGSGKTKTLTHRIAHLVGQKAVDPQQILAVTFTNKAAREMRVRIADLLGQSADNRQFMPWMGTFHGICVRLLKRDGHVVGIRPNFVIYDDSDKQGLIKQAIKQLQLSNKELRPKAVSSAISTAKNDLMSPAEYDVNARYPFEQAVAKVYERYEKLRKEAGALDFDDLLLEVVHLLSEHSQVRQKWRENFRYILIDEYQDTNSAQYQIVKMLVNESRNICVVGDDWQSIYSWRGADFTNILNFEKDFPGAKVVKLEQNYRSTAAILEAAQNVISKNAQRTDKKLWTDGEAGLPVQIHQLYDEVEEAYTVASDAARRVAEGQRRYQDVAVLYLTNAQSYALERALLQHRVPYQIIGGVRFYDRKEIKDIIAYLRLIYQPNDRMSFSRIVNVPKRGIGATSLEKFLEWQAISGYDIITALVNAEQATSVTKRARSSLAQLGEKLRVAEAMALNDAAPADVIEKILDFTHYRDYLLDDAPETAEERDSNIGALVSDAKTFAGLADFLDEIALMSSVDTSSDDDKVTLMTLHAAKGLEFPVVYMVGMEEGLLPHMRVYDDGPAALEEERRLCYVGMTRARHELHLTYVTHRLQFGQRTYNPMSRFISDIGDQASIAPTDTEESVAPFYDSGADMVPNFDINDRVMSQQFGAGEVVDIDGLAVSVRFDSGSTKKLNVEYARLEKL